MEIDTGSLVRHPLCGGASNPCKGVTMSREVLQWTASKAYRDASTEGILGEMNRIKDYCIKLLKKALDSKQENC